MMQFFGGWDVTEEGFSEALARRSETLKDFAGLSAAMEIKKAFDAIRVSMIGKPQYPATDIGSLIGWHRRNELVYACVEKIAQASADPECVVQEKKSGEWATIDGHPLRRLMLKPNPLDDAGTFMGAWATSEHIAGAFYAEIVRNEQKIPVQLWPLDPCKIRPIAGKGKNGSPIIGYEWRDGADKIDLKPEDVLVRRNHNLTSRFHGLAPLEVALGAADADRAQTDYIRAFFNNGGVPSGILTFKNRTLTKAEMEQKRQAWTLRYGRGGVGERGIAVLDQNAEYQKIGAAVAELEADSLRGQFEARLCMVFGVPPLLVGAYVGLKHVNQRASAREAQNDFWINKMSPYFKALRSFLTWNLLPEFVSVERIQREEARVFWDMTNVLGLQEDADTRHARARADFAGGLITQNEGRQEIGRDATDDGDFYMIPSTLNPRTGEVTMAIAQRPPQAPQPPGEGNGQPAEEEDEKGGNEFDELKGKMAVLMLGPATGKTRFDLDGLPLAREPKGVELLIDLKAIAKAPEAAAKSIKSILLDLRRKMIVQATNLLAEQDPAELHTIVLTPPKQVYKSMDKQVRSAFLTGRKLVAQEAEDQATAKGLNLSVSVKSLDIDDEEEEDLDRISETTIAKVVNDIQARAAGILGTLAILRVAQDEIRSRIRKSLEDSSTSYVEQAAKSVANAAVNMGRDAEIVDRSDEIDRVLYSAILDVNTCEQCEAEDGTEAKDVGDLAPAPNDECLGGDKCRCFHVAVFATEPSRED